jgi:hypothetical protein
MLRVFLSGLAIAVLYTALMGCGSNLSRGISYCQENFFGIERLACEQKMRHEYG